MKTIITAVIAIICVVAGAAGGHFLKTGGGSATVDEASDADAHEEKAAEDKHSASNKSHGGKDSHSKGGYGDGKAASGDVNYFRFSREFVIPLMRNERVASLVILNISLETDSSASDQMFLMEPKLRDNIMTTLVHLSNEGSTLSSLTDVDNYERVRAMILTNLDNVIPNGVHNVLILDAAKQDL